MQLQRARDRVAELERQQAHLLAQIEVLVAQRAQLASSVDDENERLHRALTGSPPQTITSDRNECIRIGASVEAAEVRVCIDWHGTIGAVYWKGRADLHDQDAIALADALSASPPEAWEVRRVTLPRSGLEFLLSRQSPSIEGPVVLDVIERDAHGNQLDSHALKLSADAVHDLCGALRQTAGALSEAQASRV